MVCRTLESIREVEEQDGPEVVVLFRFIQAACLVGVGLAWLVKDTSPDIALCMLGLIVVCLSFMVAALRERG